jgi:glutamyl-Q tRNA(Asp) synthetase
MSLHQTPPVFRFAPSPNGRLHLGHAYSALLNESLARKADGKLLLRIENVDRQRSRPEFERAIIDDLNWLGIAFDEAPRYQSEHLQLYQTAIDDLIAQGFAYRSTISRSQIAGLATTNPNWPRDPDGAFLAPVQNNDVILKDDALFAIRLDMKAAMAGSTMPIRWCEGGTSLSFDAGLWGDVVLKSRDGFFAYHTAVVIDDHVQGITDIVRGRDLYAATAIHRILQNVLGYTAPNYLHHDLILDNTGEKLAKSRNAPSLISLRNEGVTAAQLRKQLGFSA